ncbi:MAG TPA: hypothetical protein VNC22_14360 [Sporichthya sp.]|jgi:hypothetical protein|nr:hypothetical protein [Sporichthya sp.]
MGEHGEHEGRDTHERPQGGKESAGAGKTMAPPDKSDTNIDVDVIGRRGRAQGVDEDGERLGTGAIDNERVEAGAATEAGPSEDADAEGLDEADSRATGAPDSHERPGA